MLRCKECSFHKQSCKGFIETNFTSGRGRKDSEVMLIFDSPFLNDLQAENIATDKEYNNYLNRYLEKIDLNLDSIYVTTFIKCFISDKKKKPTKPMKQKCYELYLKQEIEKIKPKVIILIGRMVTQWFIPDMGPKVPLKQIIGKNFYTAEYDCQLVPVYDMFYLTNFTNRSLQVRKTEQAFAKVRALLNKEEAQKTPRIPYSHDLKDLKNLGEYISADLETTGLNPFKDKIITLALTDIKTKKTVAFDAESYGALVPCTNKNCKEGQIPNPKRLEKLQKAKTDKQKEVAHKLPETIECPKCHGNGKMLSKNLQKNKFFKEVLPVCARAMKTRKLVFHNGSFDLQFLLAEGYDLFDNLISDTRMMQFLINPLGANSLGFLVQLYYGVAYKEEIDRAHILAMNMEDRRYYGAEDTYYTARLFIDLYKKLKAQGSLTSNKIMTDTIKIIASDLESFGIRAKEELITEIIDYYQAEKDKCVVKFKKRFKLPDEFNLNSSKQLTKLLYEDLELPVTVTTASGNPSCNEEAIRKLASKRPALNTLVNYRTVKGHIEKLRGYKKAIGEDGRIHGSFNIFSPDSSRLMSSKPNIQNVPRQSRLKEVFVSAPGYSYLYYDYSQIEFRTWLHLSNDSKGIDFVNKGRDIHAFIASQFYREPEEKFLNKKDAEYAEKRNKVKAIVYGSMYGRTPEGIVAEHGGSLEEAKEIQNIFFQLCREGWMWLQQIEQKVFSKKKLITPFGTIRLFPDIELARGRKREEIVRQAKSFIVQSWAVEMVFIGMYKVWKAIREKNLDAHYVHQIHDGMILEVKDEHLTEVKKLVEEKAQSPYSKLKVPLTADFKIGKSWQEVA